MSNHPNRSRQTTDASNPTPEQIRTARRNAAMTQGAAASLVYSTLNAWQKWEDGSRRMHPAIWELFKIKAANPRRTPHHKPRYDP